jgi:hypothetical protein
MTAGEKRCVQTIFRDVEGTIPREEGVREEDQGLESLGEWLDHSRNTQIACKEVPSLLSIMILCWQARCRRKNRSRPFRVKHLRVEMDISQRLVHNVWRTLPTHH